MTGRVEKQACGPRDFTPAQVTLWVLAHLIEHWQTVLIDIHWYVFTANSLDVSPTQSAPQTAVHQPSSLFSHTCALFRQHLFSFDIHRQNTRGWATPIFIQSPRSTCNPTLTALLSLSPLPPSLPQPPLIPLDSALTKNRGEAPLVYPTRQQILPKRNPTRFQRLAAWTTGG